MYIIQNKTKQNISNWNHYQKRKGKLEKDRTTTQTRKKDIVCTLQYILYNLGQKGSMVHSCTKNKSNFEPSHTEYDNSIRERERERERVY